MLNQLISLVERGHKNGPLWRVDVTVTEDWQLRKWGKAYTVHAHDAHAAVCLAMVAVANELPQLKPLDALTIFASRTLPTS